MKLQLGLVISISVLGGGFAFAEELTLQSFGVPTKMELRGGAVLNSSAPQGMSFHNLDQFSGDIPTNQMSKFAANPILEAAGTMRSAKDAQLYRTISPSVVLVANKESFGSGSLLDASGDILTNWHVVNGYDFVAAMFKPSVDGKTPTRDDMKLARVVKYDEVADLALIKASEVPAGRSPIRLADSSEIAVGIDVHAIGHPEGESWTYTTGVISQYRQGYGWQEKGDTIKHKADVIQTQTPINPGNSGGPLLGDSGALIGVNTFKDASSEGLNFAVSVDDVRKFLARSGNRIAQEQKKTQLKEKCQLKELSRFRNKGNDATVISLDMLCTGKDNAELVTPDDKSKAIFLRLDRNGDGNVDAVIFDFKQSGKWDLSFWDEKFEGHWTLVGYHDDGSLKPTRFESYAEFQKRVSSR
jgi:S1-C subfamily serine protease